MNIITADKNGRTDSAYHSFNGRINTSIPIIIVSWVEDFVFNESLLELKEYVLFCMCEYGWNYEITDSHIWGANTDKNGYGDGRYKGAEWDKFNEWVRVTPFKYMFKRELLKKDVTDKIFPLEYPCIIEDQYQLELKDKFDSRPVNVFNFWGRSNEHRLRVHSEIWLHGYNKGFQPCDNIYYINQYFSEEKGEKWITLWMPHYVRIPVTDLLKINNLSKLCLSFKGAGFKCFRTAEAPLNSIMVMHRNNYSWMFDWNDTNCIFVEHGKEIEGIEAALKREDLYEVYINGVANANRYRIDGYCQHLENIINA